MKMKKKKKTVKTEVEKSRIVDVGDIVFLNSNSTRMTVTDLECKEDTGGKYDKVHVSWIKADGTITNSWFPVTCVTKVI